MEQRPRFSSRILFSFYSFIREAFHFFFLNNAIEKSFAARQWTLRGVSPATRDRFYRIFYPARGTFSGHARNKMLFQRDCMRLPIRKLAGHHTEPSLLSAVHLHSISYTSFFRVESVTARLRRADLVWSRVDMHAFSRCYMERYGLSVFFPEIFGKRNRVTITYSANKREKHRVYVSLSRLNIYVSLAREDGNERETRTNSRDYLLYSMVSSVIRLKIRVGITDDLRNRMRKRQRRNRIGPDRIFSGIIITSSDSRKYLVSSINVQSVVSLRRRRRHT